MRSLFRLLAALVLCVRPALAWEYWGGDRGGQRFSPLTQITSDNVGTLVRGWEFRTGDLDAVSGPEVAAAQLAAFREWEQPSGERFAELRKIVQPTLVVNGVHDEIPVSNSYALGEHLPNAVLLTYSDSGHGSLFQFHDFFTRQAAAFLASDSPFGPF